MYHLRQAILADPLNRRAEEAVSMIVEAAAEAGLSYLAERMAAEDFLRRAQAGVTGIWPTGEADPQDIYLPWTLERPNNGDQLIILYPLPGPRPLIDTPDDGPAHEVEGPVAPSTGTAKVSVRSISAQFSHCPVPEGRVREVIRNERERNRDIAAKKKQAFIQQHGRLFCEVCGWEPPTALGAAAHSAIEGHHNDPIADSDPDRTTAIDDLSLVCGNCHALLHSSEKVLTLQELKSLLQEQ
jgi:hypothetical protein